MHSFRLIIPEKINAVSQSTLVKSKQFHKPMHAEFHVSALLSLPNAARTQSPGASCINVAYAKKACTGWFLRTV